MMIPKNIPIRFLIIIITSTVYMSLYIDFIRAFPSIIIDSSLPVMTWIVNPILVIYDFPMP